MEVKRHQGKLTVGRAKAIIFMEMGLKTKPTMFSEMINLFNKR